MGSNILLPTSYQHPTLFSACLNSASQMLVMVCEPLGQYVSEFSHILSNILLNILSTACFLSHILVTRMLMGPKIQTNPTFLLSLGPPQNLQHPID